MITTAAIRGSTTLRRMICGLAASLGLSLLASGAAAQNFAGIAIDVGTGAILTGMNIDAAVNPDLTARLLTLTMAIQDVADGTMKADEMLRIGETRTLFAASAIRMTAEGGSDHRAPMTVLASRIGHNPQIFEERLFALARRIGMRATQLTIGRGADGGPTWSGRTTVRDTVRLAASLMRAHGDATRTIFGQMVSARPNTEVWMHENGACLMVAYAPQARRRFALAASGADNESQCFALVSDLAVQAESRLVELAAAARSTAQTLAAENR